MTDQEQRWLWTIGFIVLPFAIVHIFPNTYISRLLALVWVGTVIPIAIGLLVLFTKETIKLKNYSNLEVEKIISNVVKGIVILLVVFFFCYFSLPLYKGLYNLCIKKEPLTIIESSVTNISSAVLAPGMYFGLSLDGYEENYTYFVPTIFRFGDSKYKFLILPGTKMILEIEK